MMGNVSRELATTERHLPGGSYSCFIAHGTHRPSDQQTGGAVHDDCQLPPALLRPNSGDIGGPFLVGPLCLKVTL
jgi:hypothetical protein